MSRIILLNKPYGVICQFSPDGDRPTLKSLIDVKGVYPAGRLDADSEGLVVLTDDGDLQHAITAPATKMEKTYLVQVEGESSDQQLERLAGGVRVRDYTTRSCAAQHAAPPDWLWPRVPPIRERRAIPVSWLLITLTEGRNRQIRHMTAAVGLPTLRLIRIGIGPWSVSGIVPGTWHEAPSSWPLPRKKGVFQASSPPRGQPLGAPRVKLVQGKLPGHRSRKERS